MLKNAALYVSARPYYIYICTVVTIQCKSLTRKNLTNESFTKFDE